MTQQQDAALVLATSLDRLAAAPLCRTLQERLLAGEPLTLDGSGVERVSTAAIQVLVAASRSAASHDIAFRLDGASGALTEALADLGLAGTLPGTER